MNEILVLQEDHPVHYDLEEGIVDVYVDYPPGWEPNEGVIRFDAAEEHPRAPPEVFIPDEFSYQGPTELLLWTLKDGWHKLCIHTDWSPRQSLATWLNIAMMGLRHPNESNPWE